MISKQLKNKSLLLGVLFAMVISSGILISNFGIHNRSTLASATPSTAQRVIGVTVNSFGSAYLAIGNTIIDVTDATLHGYVVGIQMWVNTMPRIADVSTQSILAIGSSLKNVISVTATDVPNIYINGIYTIGNSVAYLGIKSANVNLLANAEASKFFTGSK